MRAKSVTKNKVNYIQYYITGKSFKCYFCNKRHTHGKSDGHRLPHCDTKEVSSVWLDGILHEPNIGYYIKYKQ